MIVRQRGRGLGDDDGRDPDGALERAHVRTLPRVALRELGEASRGAPDALVRGRAVIR